MNEINSNYRNYGISRYENPPAASGVGSVAKTESNASVTEATNVRFQEAFGSVANELGLPEIESAGSATSEEMEQGLDAVAKKLTSVMSGVRGNKAMFDIYALMDLVQEVSQRLRNALSEVRQLENQSIQMNIRNQAEVQRRAAICGAIAGAVVTSEIDRQILAEGHCQVINLKRGDEGWSGNFPENFIRTSMGGVQVDIALHGQMGGGIVRIKDGEGKGKDSIVKLPSIEQALQNLEKNIVRDTDVFQGRMVERIFNRYERRLAEEDVANEGFITKPITMAARLQVKDRQLEFAKEILTQRFNMSPSKVDYLDRSMAVELAKQATLGNLESGPVLDAHYDKLVSQKHLVDEEMSALYDKLDSTPDIDTKLTLKPWQPKPENENITAQRPDSEQKKFHDFAADLILSEDIGAYDKDVGKSGNLDGQRLKDVFDVHHDTIVGLLAERRNGEDNDIPAGLKTLPPEMQNSICKLLDAIIKQKGGFNGSDSDFLRKLSSDFEAAKNDKDKGKLEVDDLSRSDQVEKLGIGTDKRDRREYLRAEEAKYRKMMDFGMNEMERANVLKEYDQGSSSVAYRRQGKANFFAQVELDLAKGIDEAMATTVQKKVHDTIGGVFPEPKRGGLDAKKDSLDTIISDRGSDPQTKLLKETLEVYFAKMSVLDKRAMMARLVRNTVDGASNGLQFGEILKGAGPILQKMLQALDPDAFTNEDFKLALNDMRSNLAPIPDKAVKAYFAEVIAASNGAIQSIEVKHSCGAASVGQTFLCSIKMTGESEPRECVVKLMRPDARLRAMREAEIFREVVKNKKMMTPETLDNRIASIAKELDFTIEANNVKTGLDVYDSGTHKINKTFSNVSSMRLFEGIPASKNVMVLEKAPGVTLNDFVEETGKEISSIRNEGIANAKGDGENRVVKMIADTSKLTEIYEDALAKQDALGNMTHIWIREGLFTKTGFYHGDLHAGNIMTPRRNEVNPEGGVPNGMTMIDFGNATKLSSNEQKNVIRVIAGAAGNDPELFLKGLEELLSESGKTALSENRDSIKTIVEDTFRQGTGNDAGKRMSAVFKLLQLKYKIEVPGPINNFQLSQERLAVAMESMLKTLSMAETARLDVILEAAKADGVSVDLPQGVNAKQLYAAKSNAAIAYIDSKLNGGNLSEDERTGLEKLKADLQKALGDRPTSIMKCMVSVIKQNICTSLKTLGTSSARTVVANLRTDGIIGAQPPANPNDPNAPNVDKEVRMVEIWP